MTRAGPSQVDSRLSVPLPAVRLVTRERLRRLLDAAATGPVTVVTGGAGTGKTSAVADWARHGHARGHVAWVSLDVGDNDPVRLWTAIRTAVGQVEPVSSVAVPAPDPAGTVAPAFLDHVLGELADRDLALVLDDVQEIDTAGALAGLDQLLHRRVPGLHVVLIARREPSLSLYRLRIDGDLAEVGAADLALTEAETARLLAAYGLRLPPAALHALLATTEGWAAGLRAAAMALDGSDDPAAAAHRFDGSDPVVTGYLRDEILARAGPRRVELLLRTSVVSEVSAPLARALTGDDDAGAVLESLADAHALVERVGGGRFRCHPMLRQMLHARLVTGRPELAADLHRRASAWFEAAAEPLAALEHAVAAEDWTLAGAVTTRSAVVGLFSGDRAPLAALVDRIPDAVAAGRPELEAARAVGAYCQYELEAVRYHLDRARVGTASLPEPRRSILALTTAVLAAFVARHEGDAAALCRHGAEAADLVADLPADAAPGWSLYRRLPLVLCATGEMWLGHAERAGSQFAQVLPEAGLGQLSPYSQVHFGGHLALAAATRGQVGQARRIATGALRTADAQGWAGAAHAATAWLALAVVELARGDLDGTARALAGGERTLTAVVDPFVRVGLTLVAAGRALVAGDPGRARELVAEADHGLARLRGAELLNRLRAVVAAGAELAVGRAEPAAQVLRSRAEISEGATEGDGVLDRELVVLSARIQLVTGQALQAREVLRRLAGTPGAAGVDACLALALEDHRLRRDGEAATALARALSLAAVDGVLAPFLYQGPRLDELLRRHQQMVGTHRELVELVLARRGRTAVPAAPAGVPLTPRELSVLACLSAMSTNTEIAEELSITVNTVKHHLKSIYRKLGVDNRREAVRVVRRLDLLPATGHLV